MKRSALILAGSLLTIAGYAAHADPAFVCGDSMVETGMGTTREEVLEKCGAPTEKDEDRWYYRNQPGQITVVLTFETGKLEQIEQIRE